MTRSYRKTPILPICGTKRRRNKDKKNMTRSWRRVLNALEDPANYSWYKKLEHSWIWDPTDGKSYQADWLKKTDSKQWYQAMGK